MDDGNICYVDAAGDICERFDISDVGYGILEGYSSDIYMVDDAVAKFLETIEWVDRKLDELFNGIRETCNDSIEHRIDMDYSETFDRLSLDIGYYSDLRDILQKDLNSLTGHQVPW